MIVTTANFIPNKELEILGLVKGNVVQAKNIGRDFMASLKNIAGGEIKGYTEMLAESRDTAYFRMVEEAKNLGADAIICMRFTSASLMQGTSEMLAYGTAVKFV